MTYQTRKRKSAIPSADYSSGSDLDDPVALYAYSFDEVVTPRGRGRGRGRGRPRGRPPRSSLPFDDRSVAPFPTTPPPPPPALADTGSGPLPTQLATPPPPPLPPGPPSPQQPEEQSPAAVLERDAQSLLDPMCARLGVARSSPAARSSQIQELHRACDSQTAPNASAMDAAAHLKMLSAGLTKLALRLQQQQASIQQVRGSVSVLLDAALCAMCAALVSADRLLPTACLGPRDEQLLEPERAAALLDHVAFLLPAV